MSVLQKAKQIGAYDARHREHLVALARQLTSSASLKAKAFRSRSALAERPFRHANRSTYYYQGQLMFEQHRNLQSANGGGVSTVVRHEITITNELGLHARPAAEFVIAAKAFRSQIWLVKESERFSANSIIEVLTANLNCGDTAIIEAEGPDADEAIERLAELITQSAKTDSNSNGNALRRKEDDF